jgi:CheY-like chemotaxis protein
VVGDAQRLSQIFVNIMGNAIKFTPSGGTVTLNIREKKSELSGMGCYEFVFEDNGIGMEQDFVDRIFEPFARAADSRTARVEGTGLGMAIALNVARLMGGDIKVESRLGIGSRFTVTVYLKINNVTPEDIQMLATLPVLVVDDDEMACESACEILDSLAMRTEYALSGAAAVQRVIAAHEEEEDFSLIIIDWKMPGMDGLQATREIRKVVGNEVPIIILSAYDWSEIEQEAAAAGVNAFIEKPLFKTRLTHVLKDVIGIRTGQEVLLPEHEPEKKHDYSKKRVLLVEDNELNVEVAQEIIEMLGIKVEVAYDGKQAVDCVMEHEAGFYDLIFMDIRMPVMDGYEAAAVIRSAQRQDLKEIPIVAMTAEAFTDDVRKAREAGMDGHIAKPIDIPKLQYTIDKFLTGITEEVC